MILYTNGDECTAAAKAANPFSFANDDINYVAQGLRPHPDNLAASWGMSLSRCLGLGMKCQAESHSSNDRILRTTQHFISDLNNLGDPYLVMVIGWTDWYREEWFDAETNEYYQVTQDNLAALPQKWTARHRQWARDLDHAAKQSEWHAKAHELHVKLSDMQISHLFFNSQEHLSIKSDAQFDWHGCYLDPYDPLASFDSWCRSNDTHGLVAQRRWADVLFSRLTPLLHSV